MQDIVTHFINLVEDDATKAVVDFSVRKVLGVFMRRFETREKQAEAGGDARRVEIEIERLRETMAAIADELGRMKTSHVNWRIVESEASEPAFEEFVDEAFSASAGSRTASKRMTLGRLIAHRMLVESDTPEEMSLRRALHIVRDLTESQLLLLAAIVLVHSFRALTSDLTFASRDQAEEWLRLHYAPTASVLQPRNAWTNDDLEMLDSLNAVRLSSDDGTFYESAASPVDQWLMVHGVDQFDGIEGEVGTKASHESYRRRFPTITMLQRLCHGNGLSQGFPKDAPILDATILTPLGATIGSLVLEKLLPLS